MALHPCTKCGKLIDGDEKVCADCGGGAPDLTAGGDPGRKRLPTKVLVAIVVSDLVLIAVLLYLFVFRGH